MDGCLFARVAGDREQAGLIMISQALLIGLLWLLIALILGLLIGAMIHANQNDLQDLHDFKDPWQQEHDQSEDRP